MHYFYLLKGKHACGDISLHMRDRQVLLSNNLVRWH